MDIEKDIWTVQETVVGTRTVYVKATSKSEALKAARDGMAFDWGDIDYDPSRTTYKTPSRER